MANSFFFPYDLRLVDIVNERMVLEVQCVINEAASPRSIDIYVSPKYIREIEAKFYAEFGRRKEKTAMMKETRKAQGQAAEQVFLAEQAFFWHDDDRRQLGKEDKVQDCEGSAVSL